MFNDQLMAVAKRLVECCQTGEEARGLDELYAPDAVSAEAVAMGDMPREAQGLDAIKGKHDWWNTANEVHETTAEGPFLYDDDRFGVIFSMDFTNKQSGERQQGRELGVYTVRDGKIVREEFFYEA